MEKSKSYVYFAFKGDFNPDEISDRMDMRPTRTWRKGEASKPLRRDHPFSLWELSTIPGKEPLDMNILIAEIIDPLREKIGIINQIKSDFGAYSILQIKMDIDINENSSTPYVGHDLGTIEFLYKTKTETDIDIYTYNSTENETP